MTTITKSRRKASPAYKVTRKRVASLRSPLDNHKIYDDRPADHPDSVKLDESIRREGLHEPIISTKDNAVASGNRRLASLKRVGRQFAPCRVIDVYWSELTQDERIALLRKYNLQRYKSIGEQLREALIDIDPEEAHRRLLVRRHESVYAKERNGVNSLEIEGTKRRHGISEDKADHVKYIKKIVFEDRVDYWPLSVRAVHYPLLNYTFYRNISKKLKYQNDDRSYSSTSDLITRMRLSGELPWHAFDDGTRPITLFPAFSDARQFVNHEVRGLFGGYWRDLLQTQANHFECVVEKNTIYNIALRVTQRFQIPTSSARGFNSIGPWRELYDRFTASGKRRLIVIVLSDYDPEGEMIPHVAGRTLRDDFGISDLEIIKAGVTRKQIEANNLPKQNFAKEDSKNHAWFVERNGGDDSVYELEALDPAVMLRDLESVVTSVLDIDLYNREVIAEREEAAYLEGARLAAIEALKGLAE